MKKKAFLVMMAMVMVMSCFTGCGKQGGESGVVKPGIIIEDGDGKQSQVTPGKVRESVVDEFLKNHPEYNQTDEDDSFGWNIFSGIGSSKTVGAAAPNMVMEVAEACCDEEVSYAPTSDDGVQISFNTEEYSPISENGFHQVVMSPLSTFSADVDTASYSNVRRFLNSGYSALDIPKGAIRTEEMINYFDYDYNLPQVDEPFGVTAEIGQCPWNEQAKLVTLGLKTQKIDFSESPDSNIVFLIDVSGSMYEENKLPLLVESFTLMLDELGEKDRVSIVTYAGDDKIVLEGVPASEKAKIVTALQGLQAGGGTNGGKGILSAYKLAESNFIEGGNNRVILATDGDLNIGVTNTSDLQDLMRKEGETGIFLTILGFGTGNYSDANLEAMADAGNGNYAYIDNLKEAKKVLGSELSATMLTVAKDVKLQVEFNPAVVSQYRLIGYEDRLLQAEDFKDDTKDAGEIGAGHSVTAIYEIITVDQETEASDELKYQSSQLTDKALESNEWMTLSVRYKEPSEDTSKLLEYPIGNDKFTTSPSQDFIFATSVAEFSQIIRGEKYVGNATLSDVYDAVKDLKLNDEYKADFVKMVMKAMAN